MGPDALSGKTYKVRTGYGNLFITINDDEEGKALEVFATLGKSGGYFQEQTEAICRLISLALRSHIAPEYIVKHLKGIRGPMVTMTAKGTILSLPDAIGKILEEHVSGSREVDVEEQVLVAAMEEPGTASNVVRKGVRLADYGHMPACPECGTELVMAEGCVECKSCGFNRCG